MSRVVVYDIEVARDRVILGFLEDGRFDCVDLWGRASVELIATIEVHLHGAQLVGFNNLGFDTWLLDYILRGATPTEIHALAQAIIGSNDAAWQVAEKFRARRAPFDEIDLMHFVPRKASLKVLEARLGMARVVDLPFDPNAGIGEAEMPAVLAYLEHDCRATATLYEALGEEIRTREAMAEMFCRPELMRKLPAAAAEAAILGEYCRATGAEPAEIRKVAERMRNATVIVRIEEWVRRVAAGTKAEAVIDAIEGVEFRFCDGVRGEPSRPLPETINLGGLIVSFGVGGLHSIDVAGRAESNADAELVDVDVASYYPNLILVPGGTPLHLDAAVFRHIYRGLLERRLAAKAAGRKREADCLKLIINATFGKTGEPFSGLFSPYSFLATTLNGQLVLIALAERIQTRCGAEVLSANTDGLLLRIPRGQAEAVNDVIAEWQGLTGFTLERTPIASYRRQHVNSYIAIDAQGKIKSKGALSVEAGLATDARELVVAQAVAAAMRGEDPAGFVAAAAERRELALFARTLTTKGAGFAVDGRRLGRVVRVYRSTNGEAAARIVDRAKGKVGDRHVAAGCRVIDDLGVWPDDVDVEAYQDAAAEILEETDAVIDRGRNAIARALEAAGLVTCGVGGAWKVRSGGDFSGSKYIAVIVADRDDLVVVAPGQLPARSRIVWRRLIRRRI